ncbi:uncharacterized protein PFLUO_LOCUS4091 [Penicillium psychrofluorescens]|uniref:uncharacterized protein n=1 Tax=Penicillium psychrofluorescens TaxID=3158075 RepID=UPI003CCD8AF8
MLACLTPLAAWLAIAASAVAMQPMISCQEDVAITVSATASNLDIPGDLDLASLTPADGEYVANLTATLPRKSITGIYTIAGRYCEPANADPARQNTLQILVHGITYDRNYWSGMGPPGHQFNGTEYSWIDFASKEGYPTLSIDRLCNGASSKPNGLLECQIPMNAETIHGVIQAARAGKIGGRKFSKIIYVGHSEGSFTGNELAQLHPKDVDTYVLTGFTPLLVLGAIGTILVGDFTPALLVDKTRSPPSLDPTYTIATSQTGVTGVFYFGDFNTLAADHDYSFRGTVTLGEFVSALLGQLPAPGFTGSVFALTGQEDQIVCARLPTDPLVGYRGNCGSGPSSYTAKTRNLYPNAASFGYGLVPNTGHDMNFHYTAQQTFQMAHDYLSSQGY